MSKRITCECFSCKIKVENVSDVDAALFVKKHAECNKEVRWTDGA